MCTLGCWNENAVPSSQADALLSLGPRKQSAQARHRQGPDASSHGWSASREDHPRTVGDGTLGPGKVILMIGSSS